MDGITTYNNFLALHKPQLVLSGVPEHFWPSICKKITDQIFDAGLTFQLVQIDYEDTEKMPYDPLWSVIAIRDIECSDASHVYLIDHAWTFKANSIKSSLRNVPGLLERMCNLMQVSAETTEEQIEDVSNAVWKYAHTYAIGGDEFSIEERVPVWYVLDELGSGITHSDTPNFRAVPFIYVPEQLTYTLLFPVKDVEEGDMVTRNFVEGQFLDPMQREAMLIPWKPYEHFKEDFEQVEPSTKYFLEGHIVETLPELDLLKVREINDSTKLKVYSEYRYINEHLTAPEFEIVDNENDADVLWYINHFKEFQDLSVQSPHKFVNQFPFEYVMTIKDLLAVIGRRSAKTYRDENKCLDINPVWLPTTFNMKTELPKFVAYFMQRRKAGLDNHWICKPYNLARGLDTYITDNLDFLCRLPLTGPKIAQKYIDDPVLFERPDVGLVKFDIRYVILLTSVRPTEVYVYNNFFLRFANKPFSLDNFEDYEKHFTVMNYSGTAQLFKMLCADFKTEWSRQFANYDWADVEKSIFKMLSELFDAATSKGPPCGIGKSPQSRALYAADIMLSWRKVGNEKVIQPILLEMNWMPDCRRACEYYPDFYNDIFSVMFLNKEVETCSKVM
ncbi:tubulin--tyrosine ligase-like protein 12 [Spodoptera frugiperda]|uniref:Tubulin--tyrosine ligase-like protein 12 n=1 Tax=Spodoptera frugiperda TaxID=7108 RepID=A0A9R0DE74_SPOFR|nr:tubulin--tyrosine ligase-like protein 12 [Spodoptera frugiperda]